VWYINQYNERDPISVRPHTDKNREKIIRKRQKNLPNLLKMRIFLSKLANNSPISTKTLSVWENWGQSSVFFSWFSHDFCQCSTVYSCTSFILSSGNNIQILYWVIQNVSHIPEPKEMYKLIINHSYFYPIISSCSLDLVSCIACNVDKQTRPSIYMPVIHGF